MPNTIGIEIIGLPQLDAGFAAIQPQLEEAFARALTLSALKVEAEAKRLVPRVTGRLQSSIGHQVEGVGAMVARIGTSVEYAPFVEFGRGPIVATNAKALRFKIGGRWIFRHSVGPAAARPFLRPALDNSRSYIEAAFRAAADSVFAKLGGQVA